MRVSTLLESVGRQTLIDVLYSFDFSNPERVKLWPSYNRSLPETQVQGFGQSCRWQGMSLGELYYWDTSLNVRVLLL